MTLTIKTDVIRRLRDALLAEAASTGEVREAHPHRDAALARVAPFAETMYLVMIADGRSAPEEVAAVRGAIRLLTRDLLEDADLDHLLDACAAAARERGAEVMLQILGGRLCANRGDRETAITLAAAVALADDEGTDSERALVGDVAEWYGVSSKRARELLGAMQSTG